jgi:hypothetical protein
MIGVDAFAVLVLVEPGGELPVLIRLEAGVEHLRVYLEGGPLPVQLVLVLLLQHVVLLLLAALRAAVLVGLERVALLAQLYHSPLPQELLELFPALLLLGL